MDKRRTYHIRVRNGVDERALNATGPVQVWVARVEPGTTLLATRADQAALIGLLRYLHQQGYRLLSAICES